MSDSSSNVCMLSLCDAQVQVSSGGNVSEMLPSSATTALLKTYLCTQAQALFSRYRGLDCSAETMARRDEKFLRIRHSCRKTRRVTTGRIDEPVCVCLCVCVSANLSDVYPALDDPRSDVRPDLPVLQHRADHAGRHGVELRDGGAHGGGAVLVVLLVPLRPNRAQALVGHHLFEQQLDAQGQDWER